jgi:FkbM family methyltransferase
MGRRWLFPAPEKAAWRRAWHRAEITPRYTPGLIRMLDYELQYSDLLTFCPQWDDIFVKRTLDFLAATPSPRILDCGANIGLASLFFKRRYPRARITAYEADPSIHSMLESNLAKNGAVDVEAVHAAIWTAPGELTFNCEGGDSGMVADLGAAPDGRPQRVPSVRLRDVLHAEEVIDLLKLDIEGAEGRVLNDCAPLLDRVGALIMDLHEFDPADRQAPRVLELLTRAGFDYAVDDFVSLTWRKPSAPERTAFGGRAMAWAMTVRAWRRR